MRSFAHLSFVRARPGPQPLRTGVEAAPVPCTDLTTESRCCYFVDPLPPHPFAESGDSDNICKLELKAYLKETDPVLPKQALPML